jgi:hypothetical protein
MQGGTRVALITALMAIVCVILTIVFFNAAVSKQTEAQCSAPIDNPSEHAPCTVWQPDPGICRKGRLVKTLIDDQVVFQCGSKADLKPAIFTVLSAGLLVICIVSAIVGAVQHASVKRVA